MTPRPESIRIETLTAEPATLDALSDLLVETVAHGGSVSFMHPLAPAEARAFWEAALTAAARGERMVLGAWADGALLSTVTLLLDCPPNQPHRAELAKMMTAPGARGRGLALTLLREAERLAQAHGRTLLVLDTASDGGAAGLYERAGYTFAGEIPDYALKPHGGLTGTRLYYKRLPTAP
ncbi:GNAT family N-acetyltransferase [Deinococcus taeanensis]|uniref:GNAT family N-acetyltransferase n=1 Tax=Deinococcus taeanensis TaxID=2737050 RepID=UPI001CDCAAFD|nr:GNAT family N-acetyltransferase [Deinococcus taeanensis]UBV42986.1 GNAT family N-acetyltransferase [Deinococcus taeanensis]